MGRSFYRPRAAAMEPGAYYHAPSDRYYTMYVREGRYYQRRHQTATGKTQENLLEREVHYVLGSGNHSRSYLHRSPSGKLILLPLAWYAEGGGTWAMNPGYDRPDHMDFRRAISFDCMFCHNGYPPGLEEARHGEEPRFPEKLPEGIDCQRCHGPGRAHVDAAATRQPAEELRAAIVNPRRLSRERQLEVCMQCHLETTSRTLPYSLVRYDRAFFSYRPGEPLSQYVLHFDHAPGSGNDDKFEIAHAAYRLRKSACFQKSELTCTTCHNPHEALRGTEASAHYRKVCTSCHIAAHNASQDCTSCHMPKRRTEDVIHVVMTDHFIQRRAPKLDLLAPLAERHDTAETAYRGEVMPYYPERLDHELYLAAAQVNEGSNLSGGIPRLEAAIERHRPEEAMFYFELAEAFWKSGRRTEAIGKYEEALKRRPGLLRAVRNLGAALIELGELDRAADVLRQAPDDAAALANLGDALRRRGRLNEAAGAYTRAIRSDPDLPEAHHGLAQTLLARGELKGARDSFLEAIRIRPDYAEAHYNWGTALGQRGDFQGAYRHLMQAVTANPRLADARNNLGMAALALGDLTVAVQHFRKALEIDPGHADAKANLARARASLR
jgi:tetratricopeptide (TPR) repeat protein